MSGTGIHKDLRGLRDLLPLPEKKGPITGEVQDEQAYGLGEQPTASHFLATAAEARQDNPQGLVQSDDGQDDDLAEVQDLGWNEKKHHIPGGLVGGLDNEDLWMLIRRFNKSSYHVKETTKPVPGNLDMNVAEEDEFSPDKLRATIERSYMTIGIGLLGFVKHMGRLRSWKETRRTVWFCTVYSIAWIFDFVVPLFSATLIMLIVYPPSRKYLFPPAPIALVNSKTGGIQMPAAGILGSTDSATGAPENFKGEAVENEAQNLVNSVAHVALSSAVGKHPEDDPPEDETDIQDTVPDPSAMALGAATARENATSRNPDVTQDKTKVPMEVAIWNKMRPTMHHLTDIIDTWERFANALSATPPFPREAPRLRLAAVIAPILATSLIATSYMFTKGFFFFAGFGFFGDPIINPVIHWLNRTVPNWQEMLELRNTLLKGIPTNAQLTITLLRIGEANQSPIPPPPVTREAPPEETARMTEADLSTTGADAPLGASINEIHAVASGNHPAHGSGTVPNGKDIKAAKQQKHGHGGSRLLGFLRGNAHAAVDTVMGVDFLRAEIGSRAAKNRRGVVVSSNASRISGPVEFKGRYKGKKGHVLISVKATIPCIAFTSHESVEKIGDKKREDLHVQWSIAIADITEIKKIGGYGWKTKLVVGWALQSEITDGIEITDKAGRMYKVTALPLRNELFNRLIAMGGQKWEEW